jgi:hypothetical protein
LGIRPRSVHWGTWDRRDTFLCFWFCGIWPL